MVKKKTAMDNSEESGAKSTEGVQMDGDEIRQRLLEAGSDEELRNIKKTLRIEGAPQGSIDYQVSYLKKHGKLVFQTAVAKADEEVGNGKVIATRPQPIDVIIDGMKLPVFSNGDRQIFDAGVTYGMKAVVAGVRLAQELSQMAIAQASPLIRMSAEMQKGKMESAKEAGTAAAEEMAQQVVGYLASKEQKPSKVDIATTSKPMQAMMARQMERMMDRMQDAMFPAQINPGETKTPSLPVGWKDERE